MTHSRPLTAIEVETLRVALALLLETSADNPNLLHARAVTEVTTIASDDQISVLLAELEGADVDVRRPG
jgi:hypothetical protein